MVVMVVVVVVVVVASTEMDEVSKLVFYAQSTSAVISGRWTKQRSLYLL